MKKVLLLALVFTLFSCEKEEPKTTYQIINNNEFDYTGFQYLDGTLWEVIVFKYIGDDVAGQENLDPINPDGGTTEMIEIDDKIEKIKVSFKLLPRESEYYDLSSNVRKYVVSYTFLDKGENNVVIIDKNTLIGSSLKSDWGNLKSNDFNTMNDFKSHCENIIQDEFPFI